jgi:hypothetical protein
MATELSIKISKLLVNNQTGDSAGNWQYVGADAVEQSSNENVQLIAMKRDNSTCGVAFPASILTATVIFESRDNETNDHLTIQGLHDLTSNNEIGSVSAASNRFSEYIGGAFSFDAAAGVLTISPRA